MSDSTTWVGMDVHKENIVIVSISGDSGTVMARWETPNKAKGKERLAARITGLGKARRVRALAFDDANAGTVLAEYVLAVDQQLGRVARIDARIEEEAQNPGIAPVVARLKTLRGVRTLTAMTIHSELIDLSRFASPRDLMSFIGLVPSEYSSGGKQRRGSLTRAGNAHLRRVLVEAVTDRVKIPPCRR